jgi:hypothetical protein
MRLEVLPAAILMMTFASFAAPAALACINETTMAHDEAVALVKRAQGHLERGEYAEAARFADKAIHPLSRRVAIGDGEAMDHRRIVTPEKDRAALARAQATLWAAVVRSNATVSRKGKSVPAAEALVVFQGAYEGIVALRQRAPKLQAAREVEAELQARSTNLRAAGKVTLEELARQDVLSAPEAWAALATLVEEDGDPDEARRLFAICRARAAAPSQCAPVKTFGPPPGPRAGEPRAAAVAAESRG